MKIRDNIAAMAGYVPGEQPRSQDMIKLNTNESPYPPSPAVFEAIQRVLTGDSLRKYPDPIGSEFRKAAATVLGVEPDMILPGNGSDDLLTIITRTFVPEGGLLVSPTPSYILYKNLAEIQGARFTQIPFDLDWKLPTSWPTPDADLTFIPNPNSPSGTFLSHEELRNVHRQLSGPLVIDEAYVDFAPKNAIPLVREGAIITRTLSKSYALAGIRFGYAVADAKLIHEFIKVKDSYNCDVVSLAAASAAILDQDYLRSVCDKIIDTRHRSEKELKALGFQVTPSHTNFLWCHHERMAAKPIYDRLREDKILVRYMNYGSFGDGLRISIGSDHEMDRLMTSLRNFL
jgi:histidinol-phosphate aminotransferase